MTDNPADEAEERIVEFVETFGNAGFFEDGMIRSLEVMFQLCEIYFGNHCARRGFDTMVSCALPDGYDAKTSWRDHLDEVFGLIYSDTQLGQVLHDLTAYCDFGVVMARARDQDKRRDVLASRIEIAEQLLALLPIEAWGLDGERLLVVLRKSQARWKLDNGEALTAEELAILAGRAPQTIKNKLAGEYKEINGKQHHIEAEEANAWLSRQKDYYPSIWREQDDTARLVETDKGMGDVVFVPVAKDGSTYHPGLQRDGKYQIDADGAEREFDTFEEALAALQKMHFPQWRRPTPEGRWTRVRGVDWRRVSMDQLKVMPPAQA